MLSLSLSRACAHTAHCFLLTSDDTGEMDDILILIKNPNPRFTGWVEKKNEVAEIMQKKKRKRH